MQSAIGVVRQGDNNSAGESSACSYVPKVAATSTYQRTTTTQLGSR